MGWKSDVCCDRDVDLFKFDDFVVLYVKVLRDGDDGWIYVSCLKFNLFVKWLLFMIVFFVVWFGFLVFLICVVMIGWYGDYLVMWCLLGIDWD